MTKQSTLVRSVSRTAFILSWLAAPAHIVHGTEPKDATAATRKIHAEILQRLPFADRDDFEDARRGLIDAGLGTVRDGKGNIVWDLKEYSFLDADTPPETVNPSLWRQAQLNLLHGIFKVTDRVYQVRGYDLSNISFIEGDTGYIVIDPLVSAETARAAVDLLFKNRGEKPIVAVIYSHSHIDHFGGVKGIASEEDVKLGRTRIIASQGFLDEAVSENIIVGNVMNRRVTYVYGALLPRSPRGHIDAGVGKSISSGRVTLLAPTDYVIATGQEMAIDGVQLVFQFTPGAEAPTEMTVYFPQFKALYAADNSIHSLHNLYTLRKAEVRDAREWSRFLNETIELFGHKSDAMFAGHTWPRWSSERIVGMLKKQGGVYRYIHDQTLHLANQGYSMTEIAETLTFPDELAREWCNRGYYGTVSHNAKAVYQKYIGSFDGNPANLNSLPRREAAKRYVEFMGGPSALLEKARASYAQGDYRWVVEVVNHLIFTEPDHRKARELQADSLEQLGYQAESGPWRNYYLSGTLELRGGVVKTGAPNSNNADVAEALRADLLLDYFTVHLNGPRANGKKIVLNWNFTDTRAQYVLSLENSALS